MVKLNESKNLVLEWDFCGQIPVSQDSTGTDVSGRHIMIPICRKFAVAYEFKKRMNLITEYWKLINDSDNSQAVGSIKKRFGGGLDKSLIM